MSVPSTTDFTQVTLSTNPQVVPVTFVFNFPADLLVLDSKASPPVTLVNGSDYTVTGGNGSTGSITTIAGGANNVQVGDVLTISRNVPLTQNTNFTNTGPLTPAMIGQALDKLTEENQQINQTLSRALQFPGDEITSGLLPGKSARAGNVSAFDASGNPTVIIPTGPVFGSYFAQFSSVATLRLGLYATAGSGALVKLLGYYTNGDGGGGDLYVDKADTTTADNAFSVFVANDGTRLKREKCQSYDVRMAGVRTDGTDSTVRLQACAAYSMANGCIFDLPEGTINCTGNLDFGSSVAPTFGVGPKFRGAGRDATTLRCTAANVPIIKFGGSFGLLTGLTVTYSAQQSVAQTNAAAIRFYAAQWFVISDVAINNSFTPFDIYQGAVVSGANYIFSCSIRDVRIVGFTGYVMKIIPYNGGCMGVSISNVWANYPTGTALGGYVFTGMSDSVITAIDVENVTIPRALYVSGCTAISINGMHIELATITGTFDGLFTFDGGTNAVLNNVRVLNCTFSATTRSYLFRVSSSASLYVATVNASAITITTAVKLLETDSAADNSFEAVNLVVPDFVGYDLAGPVSVVKRINDTVISLTRGFEGLKEIVAAVAPTTGTWAVGDIAWNLFAAPTGYVGWVCTTAGTPGTWKGFGVIQA